jgi:hypothetical protein
VKGYLAGIIDRSNLWKKNCGRKITAEKSAGITTSKIAAKNHDNKITKNNKIHDNIIVATKSWQQNHGYRNKICNRSTTTRRKRYGFHMCSVESMNMVEVFLVNLLDSLLEV